VYMKFLISGEDLEYILMGKHRRNQNPIKVVDPDSSEES
jgi:hypothetical protein